MITTMDEPSLPRSPELLARQLRRIRTARVRRNARRRAKPVRRQALTPRNRAIVLAKTAGRCHLCGGLIAERWSADHVLAHSGGGRHAVDNYLPAHGLCNGYRWSYLPEEFQWALKIGVWARFQMEQRSAFGEAMLRRFFDYECSREARRIRSSTSTRRGAKRAARR